ncbi:MAG: glycerol-3-phosphate dehydrogenase [Planctomycetota bacterium]|nr:MAG: glycerol-3-phosphate dehydrogenase [Planctomycetota bacterium]
MDRRVASAVTGLVAPRAERLARLGAERFDLLVIGGGITGAGVAREAARRGLRVALVEQADLAAGTSSRSSRLVHGGLRYLEQLEVGLVFEAVNERRVLLRIAPHLVTPLGFLFPIYEWSRRGRFAVAMGMWLYEALSLFRSPRRHRALGAAAVAREEPLLDRTGLRGAMLYYDCATDDARLVLETALDAMRAGAVVVSWARAAALVREGGRVCGAEVEDVLDGRRLRVRADAVVNATGPWTDRVRGRERLLRPTKGIHIVLERERLPVHYADVMFHPDDGRVLFAIPWGERTYVGTTDTDCTGDPAEVAADAADVDYLLRALARYYPAAALGADDVIATWAGLRPLVAEDRERAEHASEVSREHTIVVDEDGLVTVAGGKLTTYRRMAVEVLDAAGAPQRASHTDRLPLVGAVGWPRRAGARELVRQVRAEAKDRLSEAAAARLARIYGTRALALARRIAELPELAEPLSSAGPEIWAQVDWACREEMAETLTDVLWRRLGVMLRHRDQGLGVCEEVAARMAALLGWDAARTAREVEAYRAEVARSRRWRQGRLPPAGGDGAQG